MQTILAVVDFTTAAVMLHELSRAVLHGLLDGMRKSSLVGVPAETASVLLQCSLPSRHHAFSLSLRWLRLLLPDQLPNF